MRADMASEGAPVSEIDSRVANSIRRIEQAPVLILLCRDRTAVRADTPEEHIMSIQSTAAAGTYLLLAAHAEGLGGNWICWPLYAQEETRKALSLPETWEPQAMLFIGYTMEHPKEQERKPLDKFIMRR
jgi:nitroreductase